MKRICCVAALLPLAAWCAAAQGTPDEAKARLDKLIAESKVIGPEGLLLNAPKGAPYAADEITLFSQTLGDGTHIQRETKVAVYRDSQGRVRRETPTEIIIADPVAGVSYSLNPKTTTGRKLTKLVIVSREVSKASEAKIKAEKDAAQAKTGGVPGAVTTGSQRVIEVLDAHLMAVPGAIIPGSHAEFVVGRGVAAGVTVIYKTTTADEPIGQRMVDGLLCDGTRSVETIAAGSIGNDRPIQTVYERWYSAELKTTVRTVRSDPRTGEETFRLTNIRRGEPSPEMFQVPPGYKIVGN